jgi:predicted TIM-barrel fold metal-dependent hydrolase
VTISGMSDFAVLQFAVQRLGAERVLFAVDYPYGWARRRRVAFRHALRDELRALISHQSRRAGIPRRT